MDIEVIQKEIQKDPSLDGWLLYDFHGQNDLIKSFLNLPEGMFLSRRFFYFIPRDGEIKKIVHFIDLDVVAHLPGIAFVYSSWQELHALLQAELHHVRKLAMEYSPDNAIPTISKLDAGTADFIRKLHIEIVSSWDLLAPFVAKIGKKERKLQEEAQEILLSTMEEAFRTIENYINERKSISEYDVQQFIVEKLHQKGCVFDHLPICAVNQNSAHPHYVPEKKSARMIQQDDYVLIDAWCKKKELGAPYADFTQVKSFAKKPSQEIERIYDIVYKAQERGIFFLQKRLAMREPTYGYEVDDVVRQELERHKLSQFFVHRTGHSIDTELHGSGANFDNLETHDIRRLTPCTSYSIEPGVYLIDAFGVRLECNVFISEEQELVLAGRAIPSLPHV